MTVAKVILCCVGKCETERGSLSRETLGSLTLSVYSIDTQGIGFTSHPKNSYVGEVVGQQLATTGL